MDYSLCIVLKTLAIFTVILAVAQAAYPVPRKGSDPKADTRHNVTAADPGDRPSDPATSVTPQKPDTHTFTSNANEKPVKDRWDKVGILANYLLVAVGLAGVVTAVGTLKVIRRQANLSEVAAFAAKESAEAAIQQIQMMKEKERARIEVKATGLELQTLGEEFWNIKAGISLRNVGASRAYIRQGVGKLIIETPIDRAPTEPDYGNPLGVVTGFIDPNCEPVAEFFYFFPPENLDLSELAQSISRGSMTVSMVGYIEYETVGTRFRRDFSYAYVGHDNPLNIGARLTFSDEFKPKNDSDRISFGYWRQEPAEPNEEREIPPQKG
jgi:hypothetical protein